MAIDVFGMCNALFDIVAEVEDDDLRRLGVQKGGMFLIDEDRREALVGLVGDRLLTTAAGGSGANTMLGLTQLGATTCYTSRVGSDDFGRRYRESLEGFGVKANLGVGAGATGISVILITPDRERTMNTYLGESRALTAADVDLDDLRRSRCLYVTGYLWDTENQKEAVLLALREARAVGALVTFSLSDPFCVGRHRDDFRTLLRNHVDVVFANGEEARAMAEAETVEESAWYLAGLCGTAVVTQDRTGSLVHRGDEVTRIPAYAVKAVDATGAGDMYAAGYLYGVVRGLDPAAAGRIASWCAAQVVANLGPRLPAIDHQAMRSATGA